MSSFGIEVVNQPTQAGCRRGRRLHIVEDPKPEPKLLVAPR